MRKRVRVLGGFTAVLLALTMAASAQTVEGPFDDVPDDHLFVDDVQWMKDNKITFGCNPPENTLYCPDDNTTRGQEAAFFHRFATAGVVDAGTLRGLGPDDFAAAEGRDGPRAGDSDLVDGKHADEFAGAKGTDGPPAADSDLLDGLDSSDFAKVGDPVGDADTVDGKDADEFAAAEGTDGPRAADSDKLDGRDWDQFAAAQGEDGPAANDSANLGGVAASEYALKSEVVALDNIFYVEVIEENVELLTEVVVSCPEGTTLITGGYRTEGLFQDLSPVSITENGPVDPGEGNPPTQWKVSINITLIPEAGAVVGQATCAG